MKPFGLCGSCRYRGECKVETQTNAKVIACVYSKNFKDSKKDTLTIAKTEKLSLR